mgnify:CR=1 FL=1|jgi:hypothetical protein
MKKHLKVFGALVVASLMFIASCDEDTDPAETDLFVGTYEGTITFNDNEQTITDEDGRVTVTKVGETYSFVFGSGIPDLTGVRFERDDDNTYISVGEGLTGIRITANSLNMLVTNDRGTWTADCSR